jgi:hypothetical protein
MLPFPPVDIHPTNTTKFRRFSKGYLVLFSIKRGVHARFLGDIHMYTWAEFTLPEFTHGLSKDSSRGPRANLLKVDTHPKNKLKRKIEELNS